MYDSIPLLQAVSTREPHQQSSPSPPHLQSSPSPPHQQSSPSPPHQQSSPSPPHLQSSPSPPHLQSSVRWSHLQATPRTMLARLTSLWRGHLRDWSVLCVRQWPTTQCRPSAVGRSTAHGASRRGRPNPTPAPCVGARSSQIHRSMCSEIEMLFSASPAMSSTVLIGRTAATRRWNSLKWKSTSCQ